MSYYHYCKPAMPTNTFTATTRIVISSELRQLSLLFSKNRLFGDTIKIFHVIILHTTLLLLLILFNVINLLHTLLKINQ